MARHAPPFLLKTKTMVYVRPHYPEESAAVYAILRQKARALAERLPLPDFYHVHSESLACAQRYLEGDSLLRDLRAFVAERLENDFGHGLPHALKVAADAGALCLIEGRRQGRSAQGLQRACIVCQAAGLMHDIRRKDRHHAEEGARYARTALVSFQFTTAEIEAICYAIRSHEAFQHIQAPPSEAARFLSGCLYDADKFRWGPDNFTDTLWDMVTFFNPSLADFVDRYPGGMSRLEQIKTTFRSATGKQYGPQMIDFGIEIGKELMTFILTEFNHLLR